MFTQAFLESVIPAMAIGIVLVLAVIVILKLLAPLNAATRVLVWMLTLCALPVIQALYVAGHFSLPVTQPVSPVAHKIMSQAPLAATPARTHLVEKPVLTPAVTIPTPQNFAADLLALYSLIVLLLLGRLAVSYVRLCVLRRRTYPAPPELASRLPHWLARCPSARPLELRLSHEARSPLAIGWIKPVIVMPSALVLELTQDEFDDLGVHELAHIRRYDDWTNLLQRILKAFVFFHPAAHYITRQLNLDREIACDDWVIAAHESKSYARSLAKIVELRRYQRGTLLLTSGAFFGKRQILKRVETLLDKTRNSATGVSSFTVLASLLIAAAIISQVVHLPAVVAFTEEVRGGTHIRISDDSRNLLIGYQGEIAFSPNEQSIDRISPDGYITIDESKSWSHRRLEVRPGPDGGPEERYFLDGHEKPLDGVGRAWAADNYLFVLRETGLDAEARADRILKQRGAAGVLQEVDLIHSDHVKLQYLNRVLDQATLNNAELRRLADSAYKLSDDNEKADFLTAHQRDFLTEDLRTSYFRAVNSIRSDDDRRRVLKSILDTDGGSAETVRLVGVSAKGMSSDNDKADVLMAIPAAASGDTHCSLLKAAGTIQSDGDKARVLRDSGYVDSVQCRDAYFAVVNTMQSDNDRAGVLTNILSKPNLQPETLREIANSAKQVQSDNDKANVLTVLGAQYTDPPFFDAANTIQSSEDLTRVLEAVLKQTKSKPVLLGVIDSTARISGDESKTQVLLEIAKLSDEPEVRSALEQACQKLSSDNDYRRLASTLLESPKSVGSR